MSKHESVIIHAPLSRRFPALKDAPPEFAGVESYVLRVRAKDVPSGIPDDANPREPNLNRQVYRKVRASLLGAEGSGAFHLKHGGIVVIAERVERIDEDTYRLVFDREVKQGIANGNHSYQLILESQEEGNIPEDQYVEIKVHVGVPSDAVADLADGLNTSMQVREESLADLRNKFDWLKDALATHVNGQSAVAWHEGDDGEYDVREVLALLMALDPNRYPLEDPVGIENTYARLSTVFRAYLKDPERVMQFADIALEALELYEYIRITAPKVWNGVFRKTKIAETRPNGLFKFPYLIDASGRASGSDVRLIKPAAVPSFAAFRALVSVPDEGAAEWRYPFEEIKGLWDQYGSEVLREVHDSVMRQHNGNTHYAGRSVMLYRATSRTLELADLRRRVSD
ncbi:AIPR family protein [Protaetiibacter larvae]|uniref:AIPR family protein n=1 Tax=Protaetiibacter larvae TaxID=2592654 RepID=UPI00143D749D|nr:AIPR family protein [Protaetiibacter larvae]